MCLHKNTAKGTLAQNKEDCARRGGIVLPIKSMGLYEFIKLHAASIKAGDLYLGMNQTAGKMLLTDQTEYTASSFDFNGDNTKFGGLQCVYLKRGIGFMPRETTCEEIKEAYCLWRSKP